MAQAAFQSPQKQKNLWVAKQLLTFTFYRLRHPMGCDSESLKEVILTESTLLGTR